MTSLPPHIDNFNARYQERHGKQKPPILRRRLKRRWRTAKRHLTYLIYAPFAALVRRTGYRFVVVSYPDRIGHLASEIDWYLKQTALGEMPSVKPILLLKRRKAANTALLDVWREHVTVISSWPLFGLLHPLLDFPFLTIELGKSIVALDSAAIYHLTLNRWQGRPPIAKLPPGIAERARADMMKLGLPDDAWFVCVHSREGGYSPGDEHLHAHRNSDIASYALAMDEIVARGGYCIRMGDPTMTNLAPRKGIIDYANSALKSDYLDLFLCANTRFFIGNTSGLFIVSTIFNQPSVLVNMIPYGNSYGVGPQDISIPKKLCDTEGKLLHFPDIFRSAAASFRHAGLYREYGIGIVDNTAEEIRDVTVEMLDRLEGKFTTSAEDEARQEMFRGFLQPHHYCYETVSRIGRDFLRQHAALLEPAGDAERVVSPDGIEPSTY